MRPRNRTEELDLNNRSTGGYGAVARSARRRSFFLIPLACTTVALFTGCGKEQPAGGKSYDSSRDAGPVLLIGVDGFEWDVVLPLLAKKKLPTLAKIMNNGSYGLLESFIPTESPVIWTSVATGKRHTEHGIAHFVHVDRKTGKPILYNNGDRRVKAVWNILSDFEKRVCTIGWWMTYPVEPVNGVMVAQTNTAAQLDTRWGRAIWKGTLLRGMPGQVYPPQRQNEMITVLEDVEQLMPRLTQRIFGDFRHPFSELGRRLWTNCRWAFRADATYAHIAASLLQERPQFDLTMIYFGGPDVVGHRFWRYAYPDVFEHRPSPEQIENLGSIIDDYYAYIDEKIGELIAVSPKNVTVLVVSDHGMKAFNRRARFDPDDPPEDVNSAHHKRAPAGLLIAAGPYIRETPSNKAPRKLKVADLSIIGSVYDITPTLLAMLGVPVGLDMDGQVMTHIIREGVGPRDQFETIATHDTPEFRANRPEVPTIEAHEQERLDQLRSLGYIGGEDEDDGD